MSSDLLHLTQRILQGMPVPQPNILKRGLVVRGVGCIGRGIGRKLALREPIKAVGLSGHLEIMGDIRLFTNQLVRLDDKAADVPANYREHPVSRTRQE
ncbi:MAG: hypothetical protein QOJ51_1574 [Acidobacteriaceae bacterium]|nr:hypothetical protein [Acidobacteriaceae bacterium]